MTTRKSSKASQVEIGPPPTDVELMLYADGELDDEARHREVEAHLLRSASCRAKVAGLDIAAAAIRERAVTSRLADGIADAVMARIERGEAEGAAPAAKSENGAAARPLSVADLATEGGPAGARAPRIGKKPANDNARGIFALAAVAAAAAAAMMIWGRLETEPQRPTTMIPPSAETMTAPPPAAPEPAPAADVEVKPGVEVAAVDFGARMGTIFYVPTGSTPANTMTTVVWLSDNGTGGK